MSAVAARTGETTWTLPQIAARVGIGYRTLKTWRDRGLIAPSVCDGGGGAGHPDLYSERDACLIEGLAELRARGLDIDALAVVAATWRSALLTGCPVCGGSLYLPDVSQHADPAPQHSDTEGDRG